MKIDCTITKNYLKETQRMCDYYSDCLEGCPAINFCKGTIHHDTSLELIIQAWSDSHPLKTYLEEMLEKHKNVPLSESGTPNFCPSQIGYSEIDYCRTDGCMECWSRTIQ